MAGKNSVYMMLLVIAGCVFFIVRSGQADEPGETLFRKYCAVCHVDGGNIVNPLKTFKKKDLDANNIKTVEDVLKIMRNPGPGMTKFSEKTLPDAKAKKIAEYILSAF